MTLNYDIRRETHAIAEFSATMKFAGSVTPQTFANVIQMLAVEAKKLDLPSPMQVQVINFALNEHGFAANSGQPLPITGAGFQRFAPNGEVALALRCDPDAITITLREYDRWQDVLPLIVDTFSALAAAYLVEVPAIRSFGVHYLNEFRGNTPEIKATTEIFAKGSKWIASFSEDIDEPWHCHIGQFIPSSGPYRYLVNVNCDIAPTALPGSDAVQNYVRVLIFATLNYDILNHGPLIVDIENLSSAIETNFNRAHTMEKRILGEVISADYLAIMGGGANEHASG